MKAYAELGSALRSAREKAGRSVSDVASETGLPERYVVALEKGDMADLPDLSYARLYLQSYARSLRLDPESMLAAWPATGAPVQEARPRKETPVRSRSRWPLYVTGLLLIIVGAALYNRASTVTPRDERPGATPAQPQPVRLSAPASTPDALPEASQPEDATGGDAAAAQEPSSVAAFDAGSVRSTTTPELAAAVSPGEGIEAAPGSIPVSPFAPPPAPAPVVMRSLEVVVASQTWLVIEADGDTVVAKVATGGESVSAEARSDFRLTVANPRDLQVTLDGRPLALSVAAHRPLIRHLLPGKDTP